MEKLCASEKLPLFRVGCMLNPQSCLSQQRCTANGYEALRSRHAMRHYLQFEWYHWPRTTATKSSVPADTHTHTVRQHFVVFCSGVPVSYTHLRAHETEADL
eukprot:1134317-Amphidinium_carterae.1